MSTGASRLYVWFDNICSRQRPVALAPPLCCRSQALSSLRDGAAASRSLSAVSTAPLTPPTPTGRPAGARRTGGVVRCADTARGQAGDGPHRPHLCLSLPSPGAVSHAARGAHLLRARCTAPGASRAGHVSAMRGGGGGGGHWSGGMGMGCARERTIAREGVAVSVYLLLVDGRSRWM